MRLFVALELPADLARAVSRRVDEVRRELPPARWVPAANLHLTLAFLGKLPAETVERLDAALAPVFRRQAPIGIELTASGSFPPSRPPRVLWLGLAAGDALAVLQRRAAAAAFEAAGREPESRPFHAHLTLGRSRGRWPRRATERWARCFDGVALPGFTARRGVLMESTLAPGGARYRVVTPYPLEAAA